MKNKVHTWEDMVLVGFSLSDIKEDSEEFEIMKKAAEDGIASAQHSMGMWQENVAGDFQKAEKWYSRAKLNGHPSSHQAIEDLHNKA